MFVIICTSPSWSAGKVPGDDCPLVWGQCSHCFHMHCILKWLNSQQVQQQCPMCRQEWKFKEWRAALQIPKRKKTLWSQPKLLGRWRITGWRGQNLKVACFHRKRRGFVPLGAELVDLFVPVTLRKMFPTVSDVQNEISAKKKLLLHNVTVIFCKCVKESCQKRNANKILL